MAKSTTRACRACGEEFPATEEFFYRSTEHFIWKCKPCKIAEVKEWKRKRNGYTGFVDRPCAHCGRTFTTAKRLARHCSIECNIAARHVAEKAARLAHKQANPRKCPRCGATLDPSKTLRAKFCSKRCSERAHAQTRKFRRRDGISTRRGADEPLISLVYFVERDKGRCGLCRKSVNATLAHPDPLAPSLDHIVPIALGGTNEPANLQLVHLRCNLSKRDRPRNEQLRLIG